MKDFTLTVTRKEMFSKYSSGKKQWILKDELNRNNKLRKEDVDELKRFCTTISNVDQHSVTDQVLVALLHSSDYELKRACTTATKYFNTRLSLSEVFQNRDLDSENLKAAADVGFICSPSQRTAEGYRIFMTGLRRPESNLFCITSQLKAQYLFLDACIHEDPVTPGYIFIHDCRLFSWSHVWNLNWSQLQKLASNSEEVVPVISKKTHIVNVRSGFLIAYALLKPFMRKQLLDNFHLHAGASAELSLHGVPKECLPSDYGGLLPSIENLRLESLQWLRRMLRKMSITSS